MYSSISCIGYGNMGAAFLKAIAKAFPACRLTVLEKDPSKAEAAIKECNAHIVQSFELIFENCEALILAIKPQDAQMFLTAIKTYKYQGHILSVLGGKTSTWIAEQAGVDQVARYMPSLSSSIGIGAVALCFPASAGPTIQTNALAIAQAVGTAYQIPEHLMGAFTGISGSGIAFAWSFIHGMAMGGVQNGLAYPEALSIVLDMVEGAAKYLKASGEQPVTMLTRVCSPAGTTIEGIHALEKGGFQALCMDAVRRVSERSNELEGKTKT